MTPKYKTPEEMQEKIDLYFAQCDEEKRPYTIPGLAYALGFVSRHSIKDYAKRELFTPTIKKARLRIEQQRVENLVSGTGSTPGQIFDLKNNFEYEDKTKSEDTVDTTHTFKWQQ